MARLAAEYGGAVHLELVDVETPRGRTLRQQLSVRCVPALVAAGPDGLPQQPPLCGWARYELWSQYVGAAMAGSGCSLVPRDKEDR
jgi:hypothetical protein